MRSCNGTSSARETNKTIKDKVRVRWESWNDKRKPGRTLKSNGRHLRCLASDGISRALLFIARLLHSLALFLGFGAHSIDLFIQPSTLALFLRQLLANRISTRVLLSAPSEHLFALVLLNALGGQLSLPCHLFFRHAR
jgi:hypothetical protein